MTAIDAQIVLETERLWLRQLTMEDVPNLFEIFSDPVAMRHYPKMKSWEETEEWVRRVHKSYAEHDCGLYALIDRESREFVGECGFFLQEVDGIWEHEIGYQVLRKHWGKGYAPEAAKACRDFAFSTLDRPQVISLILDANKPSLRVAEKVGMQFEKRTVKWDMDIGVYSQRRP